MTLTKQLYATLAAFNINFFFLMIAVPTMNNINTSSLHTHSLSNLRIATHNVQSFNDPAKQNYLFFLYSTNQFNIIGLQETNFKGITSIFNRDFPNYTTFLAITITPVPLVPGSASHLALVLQNTFLPMIPNLIE